MNDNFEKQQELLHVRTKKQIQKNNIELYKQIVAYITQFTDANNRISNDARVSINKFIEENIGLNYDEYISILKSYFNNNITDNYLMVLYDTSKQTDDFFEPEKINKDELIEEDQTGVTITERITKNKNDNAFKVASAVSLAIVANKTINFIKKDLKNAIETNSNSQTRLFSTKDNELRNKARNDAGKYLQDKYGYTIEKEWIATLDKVTRDTHRELDGQRRLLNENFKVSGASGMEPGSMTPAKENMNCRCRTRQHVVKNKQYDELRKERNLITTKSELDKYKTFAQYKLKYSTYL